MAELRRELKNVDTGCENGHYTAACSVGPDTFPCGEDVPYSQLLGHPLACASENTEGSIHLFTGALDSVSEKSSVVTNYSACGLPGLTHCTPEATYVAHARVYKTLP